MENNKPEVSTDLGVIRIADEVVSTVAGLAVTEVEGVASMNAGWGTDLVEKLGKKNFGKGIKVDVNGSETNMDIYITVQFGYPIPEVGENVQKEVKLAVETMTGLTVTGVNVHVVGVTMKKAVLDEEELAADLEID
ncbi:MAG: Asp23/Gls24 family envelope stress response protein [Bacillota bacterium]|nr:Asp23/Gls24 family envelope stress response protein [Bacillota bacterium]